MTAAITTMTTIRQGLTARHRREARLKLYGILALTFAMAMLGLVFATLLVSGYKAFTQTHVTLQVFVDPEEIREDRLPRGGFDDVLEASLLTMLPDGTDADIGDFFSDGAQFSLRDMVVDDPSLIGQTVELTVPVSDPYDQLAKALVDRATPEDLRRVSDAEIALFDALDQAGAISQPLNTGLLTNTDSRFPEQAGLRGALVGTFWVLLICFAIAVPVGIGAAIYLEEFAKKGRFADIVEVNINNLAAVPSVVFGLLALSVFIGWFGLPRGAPIVGGMALALINLPTIIIATRSALKAVPPSIREAALGVGASRQQVVFGHVLPLAMPGIMTGTIIAMAHAIGETAPLLLIGMNAFMADAATTPFQAATSLPTQIFIWADSPERGFVSRTAAAILVLLAFLVVMNGLAIWLRRRFERKW
jgi:phosphate transport system permease protein